jgi:hypothetical protein
MKKTLSICFGIVMIYLLFVSCERDDICPASTQTTPKVVIEFYDVNNPSDTRNIRNLTVREIGRDTAILFSSGSAITIPLKTNAIETRYVFTLNALAESGGLVDTLRFSYATEEVYVSRACGFKVNFVDFRARQENTFTANQSWIRNIQVLENTVEDEIEPHLFIFY